MVETLLVLVVKVLAEVLLAATLKVLAEPLLVGHLATAVKRVKKLLKKLMR